jgi:hypothetical protein
VSTTKKNDKNSLGISKYCNSNDLYIAIGTHRISTAIIIRKLNFFLNLLNNNFTHKIIKSGIETYDKLSNKSLIKQIFNYLDMKPIANLEILTALIKTKMEMISENKIKLEKQTLALLCNTFLKTYLQISTKQFCNTS